MGAHKICVAVNKRAPHPNTLCHRTWGTVCGRSATARVSAHQGDLRRCGAKFAERGKERDKAPLPLPTMRTALPQYHGSAR